MSLEVFHDPEKILDLMEFNELFFIETLWALSGDLDVGRLPELAQKVTQLAQKNAPKESEVLLRLCGEAVACLLRVIRKAQENELSQWQRESQKLLTEVFAEAVRVGERRWGRGFSRLYLSELWSLPAKLSEVLRTFESPASDEEKEKARRRGVECFCELSLAMLCEACEMGMFSPQFLRSAANAMLVSLTKTTPVAEREQHLASLSLAMQKGDIRSAVEHFSEVFGACIPPFAGKTALTEKEALAWVKKVLSEGRRD